MGIKEQVFKQSIEIYGKEAQSRQAMEECAELIQSISVYAIQTKKDARTI